MAERIACAGMTADEAARLARMGDATAHEPEPLPMPEEWGRKEAATPRTEAADGNR